ncbi:DGQHR domain-containing protein [Mesorhizobium sp. B2-4-15]|uniref:DNA phosphorothioation-associated DGQHR protein 1 n=1 Tax=Mesorhizobium sp. B2-4-15 TaxID=2589934 RepID=UPI00114FAD33|nr:DNA phosphorothioation-associated DGQHR protein 1 [Mesorhizobium sp. B2-4-15]TPK59092.1 DGQHR domain-containing protein [Mesorhizobium sp. B2-4-15]
MTTYPLIVPALRVDQPMGAFFATVLTARTLLEVAFSDLLVAERRPGTDTYEVDGTQRLQQPRRLEAIAEYIGRSDSAFPNSIILAANYRPDGYIEGDPEDENNEAEQEAKRWRVDEGPDGCLRLTIPSADKLAAVIDGQHRLFSFARSTSERRDAELLCAVYLDLPKPIQAQLFATINSTQKPVDKSLTYELFGYNVEDEPSSFWSPDKLAVFLTRRLGADSASPLKDRIVVAPENDFASVKALAGAPWKVSTAVIVQGILRLISTNPKRDSNLLLTPRRERRSLIESRTDKSPLRTLYVEGNDLLVYKIVLNYVIAADNLFWRPATPDSFIRKTVGIQALFDILRLIVAEAYEAKDVSVEAFENRLRPAAAVNFAVDRFKNASGSGRSFIRKVLAANLGLPAELTDEDRRAFVT